MKTEDVVVTNLDGTLLDHNSCSLSAAEEALALLQGKQVPLVLCRNKPAAGTPPGFSIAEALCVNQGFVGIADLQGQSGTLADELTIPTCQM